MVLQLVYLLHMNLSHLDFQLTDKDSRPLDLHSSLAFQVSFDD